MTRRKRSNKSRSNRRSYKRRTTKRKSIKRRSYSRRLTSRRTPRKASRRTIYYRPIEKLYERNISTNTIPEAVDQAALNTDFAQALNWGLPQKWALQKPCDNFKVQTLCNKTFPACEWSKLGTCIRKMN